MDDDIKKQWNDALYQLEKLFQNMVISDKQQEILTQSLASFGQANDMLLSWINILDRYCSRLDTLGKEKNQLEFHIARIESISERLELLEVRLDNLGRTDSHTGEQTLEYRLDMLEGMQDIMCSAHKGHTNYSEAEYYGMHESLGESQKQLDGMQKKLDRICKLLENAEFTISGKEALKL